MSCLINVPPSIWLVLQSLQTQKRPFGGGGLIRVRCSTIGPFYYSKLLGVLGASKKTLLGGLAAEHLP